jgi:enoyl-CoA hydratase/carnithine racemase
MDMILTGRTYDARGGEAIGLSQYVTPQQALSKAVELAHKIAGNAALSNFAIVQALLRIAESAPHSGYFTEALMTTIAQNEPEAKTRVRGWFSSACVRGLQISIQGKAQRAGGVSRLPMP